MSNFEINTDDYLGFEYEEYLNNINAMAISKPSDYYKMRAELLARVKKKVVKDVYDAYYKLLTSEPIGKFHIIQLKKHQNLRWRQVPQLTLY